MVTLFVSAGTTVKVHVVDLENERVTPYVNVRPLLSSTVNGLKTLIHEVRKLVFVTAELALKCFSLTIWTGLLDEPASQSDLT